MPKRSDATRYRLAAGVAHREVEGQILVLGPRDNTLMTLNGSGALLWGPLTRGATADALSQTLARKFRIDAERARRDVDVFVAALLRKRILSKV